MVTNTDNDERLINILVLMMMMMVILLMVTITGVSGTDDAERMILVLVRMMMIMLIVKNTDDDERIVDCFNTQKYKCSGKG